MFCENCGAKVKAGASFCHNCGEKLRTGNNEEAQQKMSSSSEKKEETIKPVSQQEMGVFIDKKENKEKIAPKGKVAIILGLIVAVVALIGVLGHSDRDSISDSLVDGSDEGTFSTFDNVTGSKFDRSLYYTGISRSDLLRYPDDYYGSYVKFGKCYVLQVLEDKVYVVNNGKSIGDDYIIIDDRNNSGPNALEDDLITVFGSFSGIEAYGTTSVPIIKADRMIVNNVMPTDLEEFAQALVNGINHNRYLYKSGETTYLGGSSLQWVMAIYGSGGSDDLLIYDHEQGIPLNETYVPDVDGYEVFMTFKLAENLINPIDAGAMVPGETFDIYPIRVNGTLTEIKQDPYYPCNYYVTFVIESFEPYDSLAGYYEPGNGCGLSDFSYNELASYSGYYEGSGQTSIALNIYSSFDEGNVVGNCHLYDESGNESFALLRDDNNGEGKYTLYFDDSKAMFISLYRNSDEIYCVDVQGLDVIYKDANETETYVMTEQYIS